MLPKHANKNPPTISDLRSNWQPPWDEGIEGDGVVGFAMTLERLQQEDESTVYDWVGMPRNSQNFKNLEM